MISFVNDYNCGAPQEIIEAVAKASGGYYPGYGEDDLCRAAKKLISYEIGSEDCAIHFVSGGTQANLTVIAAALRSHEAALATEWGHIATHETGAIESCGHKVVTVPHHNGKVGIEDIEKVLAFHCSEHLAKMKLIYISQSTEWGTVYTKRELEELREFTKAKGLWLFVDGARVGSAITSPNSDCDLEDLAALTDVFTIGGTKNGAMFGEAIVISEPKLQDDFRYVIKQKGGMLAKGWLLGAQFQELFRDGLFYRLAQDGNDKAGKLRRTIESANIPVAVDSPTNQLFPILPLDFIMELSEDFGFEVIQKVGTDKAIIRLVTS
ncbi:MAG: aminotransferase class I/II-fold pyridoxal phosphate-dependent enzyme, partial [Bacillota bacterium]|nr:aminotransferase class I/II-fold pyridoxal phosphate-dependent enzyme [Bacillota bacterium]